MRAKTPGLSSKPIRRQWLHAAQLSPRTASTSDAHQPALSLCFVHSTPTAKPCPVYLLPGAALPPDTSLAAMGEPNLCARSASVRYIRRSLIGTSGRKFLPPNHVTFGLMPISLCHLRKSQLFMASFSGLLPVRPAATTPAYASKSQRPPRCAQGEKPSRDRRKPA
jgi:hypothetical protein